LLGCQASAVGSDPGGFLIVSEFLSWRNLRGFSEGNAIARGQQVPNPKASVDRRSLESYLRWMIGGCNRGYLRTESEAYRDETNSSAILLRGRHRLGRVFCNNVTTQARQEIRTRCGLTSEAYGSAWENRNLRSIDTYRSCTKGLQKTAYLHLGNSELKYM
jgi:hypothetical protein